MIVCLPVSRQPDVRPAPAAAPALGKWLTLWAAACLPVVVPAPARAADLTLERSSGFTIDAVVNGRPLRLRVSPSALGDVLLNPEAARTLGLKSSSRDIAIIGPVKVGGGRSSAVVSIGGVAGKQRIYWYEG